MEPKTSPLENDKSKKVSPPTLIGLTDAEDYFELAFEDDEFGVHAIDRLTSQ